MTVSDIIKELQTYHQYADLTKRQLDNIYIPSDCKNNSEKQLNNTNIAEAKKIIPDLEVFGDGDAWKLICKASSKKEGWMKSTKAMQLPEGCLVQVTTQQGDNIAEALTYVANIYIKDNSLVSFGELSEETRRKGLGDI